MLIEQIEHDNFPDELEWQLTIHAEPNEPGVPQIVAAIDELRREIKRIRRRTYRSASGFHTNGAVPM